MRICNWFFRGDGCARTRRSGCPINLTLEVVGDKWSLLIIRDMIFGNRRHFRELLTRSEEGIASNILADRLKTPGRAGHHHQGGRPDAQAEGDLQPTEQGIELLPVLAQMSVWGRKYLPVTEDLSIRAQLLEEGGTEAVGRVHGRTARDPSGRIASWPAKIRPHVSRGQIAGGVRGGRRQAQDVGVASLTRRGRWLVTRPSQAQW